MHFSHQCYSVTGLLCKYADDKVLVKSLYQFSVRLFTSLVKISRLCCFVLALCTVYCLSLLFVIVVIPYMMVHTERKRDESLIIATFRMIRIRLALSLTVIGAGVTLLAVTWSNSLAVLFICESQTGLKNLGNLYGSGELRSILEELFTSWLVAYYPQATVHIKKLVWKLSDYCRCFLYFNPFPKRELHHHHIT